MTDVCEIPAGNATEQEIVDILKSVKTIAVVGLSPKEERDSHRVAAYLKKAGYRIIPVRPGVGEILGEKAYADLADIPPDVKVDMVDIFRKPETVMPVVEAAIKRGDVRVVWMQERIVNNAARELAISRGLSVVMDRCAMKEHRGMRES
jgi:predicted CoA-binding protein